MRLHGIHEAHENRDIADVLAEEVEILGYAVVPEVLDESELEEARWRIDAAYERQVEEIGGQDVLEAMNDADIARCLLEYDDFFVEVAANQKVQNVVEKLLGDYVVLMSQNAIINQPREEHYQHSWHRDLNHQHFTSSRPLAISALYCIDDFSPETGGTHLLPVSHRIEGFPSQEFIDSHSVIADAPAGSALLFDAMIFHRAGENRSGKVRRAVNHIFTLPFLQQQISLPSALNGRFADDPRLRRLLGYEAPPAANALTWRRNKLPADAGVPAGTGGS
jgi:ectoine hydroxylase-related dioxygenase (phytanoyl-CoA dioxygenase family)